MKAPFFVVAALVALAVTAATADAQPRRGYYSGYRTPYAGSYYRGYNTPYYGGYSGAARYSYPGYYNSYRYPAYSGYYSRPGFSINIGTGYPYSGGYYGYPGGYRYGYWR